jgi:CDP-paratose 2-epimerase
MKILVKGSSGLIGSDVCSYFEVQGLSLFGIDIQTKSKILWTKWRYQLAIKRIAERSTLVQPHRSRYKREEKIIELLTILHTAAQPSHDKTALIPFEDFDVNAGGTLNLFKKISLRGIINL